MKKCPDCGKKLIDKPIKNEDGSFNWKCLIPDAQMVLFALTVIFLLMAYKSAVEGYEETLSRPIEFCQQYGCICDIGMSKEPLYAELDLNQFDIK